MIQPALTVVFAGLLLAGALTCARAAGDVGVRIEKFTISRDDSTYECFPSLTRLASGRLVLTYRESDTHSASQYCRLIVRTSDDNGATFSPRHVLVEEARTETGLRKWNCPKAQQLADGRVLLLCDVYSVPPGEADLAASRVAFFFSRDDAVTWDGPVFTTVPGIMPDEVIEVEEGHWLLATHLRDHSTGNLVQVVSHSQDGGKTWKEPVTIASRKGYDFCEASILKLPGGELVCYMRENSSRGRPVYKSISRDGGRTWEGPFPTLMESGHRPVAHLTRSGRVMVTYRHFPGARSPWAKNTFAYLESVGSALEPEQSRQSGIVLPLDHDRSASPDSGYTGWVEYEPGRFLVVNYIRDDAPAAQIRGYRFSESDF
ncbi:MAG: sialidase family protein [Armatimonadota bacterium]